MKREDAINMMEMHCIYEYKNQLKDEYNWIGRVICTKDLKDPMIYKIDGVCSNIEKLCLHSEDSNNYILGIDGVNFKNDTLEFTVFSNLKIPIEYSLKYDENDKCYYGSWYYVVSNNISKKGGKVKIIPDVKLLDDTFFIRDKVIDWIYGDYYELYEKYISYLENNASPSINSHLMTINKDFEEAKEFFNEKYRYNIVDFNDHYSKEKILKKEKMS